MTSAAATRRKCDQLPFPRLTANQLNALAVSVRSRAGADDQVADSVAAALESVSRRRSHGPWRLARDAAVLLLNGVAREGFAQVFSMGQWLVETKASSFRVTTVPRGAQPLRARTAAPKSTVRLTPDAVRTALVAVEHGDGLSPELCEALVLHGWVEWLDRENGGPIDMNDPRSMLCMTPASRSLLEQSQGLKAA